MKYYAKVVSINENDEYEVTLNFGTVELVCFIEDLPNSLCKGEFRLVELIPFFISDIEIKMSDTQGFSFKRFNNTYKYELNGYLKDDMLFLGSICIQDYELLSNSIYDCNYVTLEIDRLGVAFRD